MTYVMQAIWFWGYIIGESSRAKEKRLKQISKNSPIFLVILAITALLSGLWAGLVRIGWPWPAIRPALPMSHGPLMVSGFFGTLILLERAVALKHKWAYLGPVFCGSGGLLVWIFRDNLPGKILISLGSFWMVLIFLVILRRVLALYTLTMATGALCWLAGNLLWLAGRSIPEVVMWWVGYLVLTIAGERLELSRVTRPSQRTQQIFLLSGGVIITGLLTLLVNFDLGIRMCGIGLLALSLWLFYYDVARKTIRMQGLPRFIAICLLAGYFWMAVSGILILFFGAYTSGPIYDSMLHSVFVGFVFSMVFGHAPIIFPAVLQLPLIYSSRYYVPLVLLHGSLLTRLTADLLGYGTLRLYSGLTNALAILIYAGLVARSILARK